MGILDALCDLEVVDFIDALGHLVDKIVPKPQLLERDMLGFATALGKLNNYSTARKRPLADLAADAEMLTAWTGIRERISERARDFHGMEEYVEARREGNLHQWLGQWRKVKRARKRVVKEKTDLEDILDGARKHRIDAGKAIYKEYGPMQALLDEEDDLITRIDAVEDRIDLKIAEINASVGEMADFPVIEKDLKDFDAQNKVDMEKLDVEMQGLVNQRTVLTRRIYEYEVARRRVLDLPELPKPQLS